MRGDTLYVNTTGSGGVYRSIQDAIDAASHGYTVFVFSGAYHEILAVNKTINLTGEDKDTTTVNGDLTIMANWLNVTGFTINGKKDGIVIHEVHNCSISNNTFKNTERSIKFSYSEQCNFIGNIIIN